ncbi:MAG: ABC transporter permease [Lachnospiraceae bacterium]
MKHWREKFFCKFMIGLFIFSVIFPMLVMIIWVFTERWAWPDLIPQIFSGRALEEVLGRKEQLFQVFASSVFISVVVAFISVIIGTMTARALTFYEFPGKNLFYFLSILPFLVPATVFAMGIQVTFIKLGLNNSGLGVIIAHVICSLPYAVRLMNEGTEAVGNRLEEQARVLGAGAWKAFYKVTLPVLTPSILASMSMAYVISFSQYFVTLLIGGGQVKTFAIVMVPYLQSGERNIASIYSLIFLILTLFVFGTFEWLIGRWNKDRGTDYYYN